jgi:hypothetical protein
MIVFIPMLASCAADVTLRGELRAPSGASPGSHVRPRIRDAVVWLDRIPVSTERRIGRSQPTDAVLLSGPSTGQRVVVAPPDACTWIENRDRVYHMPFIRMGKKIRPLGVSRPASTTPLTLPRCGVLRVFCRLHSNEEVWVRVVPNHAYACADRLGRFHLPPVPNGSYVVRAWHPELGETAAVIEVRGPHPAPITLRFPGRSDAVVAQHATMPRDAIAAPRTAGMPRTTPAVPAAGRPRVARSNRATPPIRLTL